MQGKGSEFHAHIEDLHVEVSPPVGDPSLQRATSPVVSTSPFTTSMDGHHMSAIVTVHPRRWSFKIIFPLSRVWKL